MAEEVRHDRFREPEARSATDKVVQAIVDLTGGGADFSFDATGNVPTSCDRRSNAATGVGANRSSSASPRRASEIATRPFQLVTGRVWKGTAFGGARGRTDVPKIVDWYMEGKINIDDLITHKLSLDEINHGFDLMHEGKSIRSVVVY